MNVYIQPIAQSYDVDRVQPFFDLVHVGDLHSVDLHRRTLVVLEDDDHIGGGGAERHTLEVNVLDFVQSHHQALGMRRCTGDYGLFGDVNQTIATRREQNHLFEGSTHERGSHIRHIELDFIALPREVAERLVQSTHRLTLTLFLLDFLRIVCVGGDSGEIPTGIDDLREELHIFAFLATDHDRIQQMEVQNHKTSAVAWLEDRVFDVLIQNVQRLVSLCKIAESIHMGLKSTFGLSVSRPNINAGQ